MSEPKYINVNGVPRINPAWQQSHKETIQNSTVADSRALPVFSSLEDYRSTNLRAPKPLLNVFETVQAPDYTTAFGANEDIDGGDILDEMSHVRKYFIISFILSLIF